jgi:hypothetical protein
LEKSVKSMKQIASAVALGTALLTGLSSAEAGYVVTLQEIGSDVVATGSGPIDLTGLSSLTTGSAGARVIPSIGQIITGPPNTGFNPIDRYTGFSGPTSIGSGGVTFADSGSGDLVGITGSLSILILQLGYVSGDPLSDTTTYTGKDFTTLGVTPGTYIWTWGTGVNQNFTLIIGATAVPEPASAALLGAALAGLLLSGAIRRTRDSA